MPSSLDVYIPISDCSLLILSLQKQGNIHQILSNWPKQHAYFWIQNKIKSTRREKEHTNMDVWIGGSQRNWMIWSRVSRCWTARNRWGWRRARASFNIDPYPSGGHLYRTWQWWIHLPARPPWPCMDSACGQPSLSSLSAVPAALSTWPTIASTRSRPASQLLPEEEAGAALRAGCSSE
jgi:hypothetical protein